MLQLPLISFFNKGRTYDEYVQMYLPQYAFETTITKAKQDTVLQQLDKLLHKEQFYFITDVKTGNIIKTAGVYEWLGYTDLHFTQKKYLDIIHPSHNIPQYFFSSSLFEVIINKKLNLQYLKPITVITLALKSNTGKYFYCIKKCYPFQFTKDKKLTEYLSEFTVVKEYTKENYSTRLIVEPKNLLNEQIKKTVQRKFEESNFFSVQELRILKRYAKKENLTSIAIAKAFKIEKATVDTYNKRILKKAENIFGESFENARLVGEYLKALELL